MVYIIPKSDNVDYYIERTIPGECIDIFFDTDIPVGKDLMLFDFENDNSIQHLFQKNSKKSITSHPVHIKKQYLK